jgi:catechol 2,3-dioxygenase-like lactoylglutathione lyase family enzyme
MRRFDHIDLRVTDKAVALAFYSRICGALGFPHIEGADEWICFSSVPYPEIGEYIALSEDPRHKPSEICHAFWAASKRAVDQIAEVLRNAGAANIEGPAMFYKGHYAVYFEDPTGNRFEVCYREYTSAFDPRISESNRA